VEVPQARDPEAQGAGAQHGGQQLALGGGQRAHRVGATKARRRAPGRGVPVGRSIAQSFRQTAMSNSQVSTPAK
jgi:hypothetical protein